MAQMLSPAAPDTRSDAREVEELAALVKQLLGGRPKGYPYDDIPRLVEAFRDLPFFAGLPLRGLTSGATMRRFLASRLLQWLPNDPIQLTKLGLPAQADEHDLLENLLSGSKLGERPTRTVPVSWDAAAEVKERTEHWANGVVDMASLAIAQALLAEAGAPPDSRPCSAPAAAPSITTIDQALSTWLPAFEQLSAHPASRGVLERWLTADTSPLQFIEGLPDTGKPCLVILVLSP